MKVFVEKIKKINTHKNKNIIIIPKRNVKKAHLRNKIRRQIRAILHEKQTNGVIVKYLNNEQKPNFQTMKAAIISKIKD